MTFFFRTDLEQMIASFGGEVRYVPGLTHPRAAPRDGRAPIFFVSAGLPSPGRDRQLRDLLMGELLARADEASIGLLFRQLYAEAWAHTPAEVRRE